MADINASNVRYAVAATTPRATPPSGGRRFRDGLGGGARALLAGVEGAAAFVPGAALATAAIRAPQGGSVGAVSAGLGEGAEAPGASPSATLPPLGDNLRLQVDQSLHYLQLQEQISSENRRFSALSNVMKARHDTAKSAINNIK
jgi:hypothetical protein